MELKALRAEFKLDASARTFEGHAAVFNNLDSWGDIIQPGAFARTISSEHAKRVKVLWQHDANEPIGRPVSMTEDEKGLKVTAAIADTTRGRDVLALMDAGVIDELSIGYETVRWSTDADKGIRHLEEVKLFEFSPVTWAANELARITSVKHARDLRAVLDKLERLEWTRGRLESPALREKAERAIKSLEALLSGEATPTGTPPDPPVITGAALALESLTSLEAKVAGIEARQTIRNLTRTLRS